LHSPAQQAVDRLAGSHEPGIPLRSGFLACAGGGFRDLALGGGALFV
jgi:hypothetical protein